MTDMIEITVTKKWYADNATEYCMWELENRLNGMTFIKFLNHFHEVNCILAFMETEREAKLYFDTLENAVQFKLKADL